MKYKIILSVLFLMFISSCASKQMEQQNVTPDSNNKSIEPKKNQPQATVAKSDALTQNPIPEKPIVNVSKVDMNYEELDKAIASQDDDRIKAASLELLYQNSKDVKALNALAMYYFKKEQFGAAELLLNRAVSVKANTSGLYNNLGLLELIRKNERKALVNFQQALNLRTKNQAAAQNLSSIYTKQKDYKKAAELFRKMDSNDTLTVADYNNYAVALNATGKEKDAADYYEKILKVNPENRLAMLNYSILLINKQGKFQDGLDLINRLKFVGISEESRQIIKDLEIRAKAGLK